jgi:DNA-directed RNA polymerase specialized sigma24 family protein
VQKVRAAADRLARARKQTEKADQALRAAVTQARRDGASWADVGRVLGITRQTAQQRFGRARVPLDPEPTPPPVTRPVQGRGKQPRSKR